MLLVGVKAALLTFADPTLSCSENVAADWLVTSMLAVCGAAPPACPTWKLPRLTGPAGAALPVARLYPVALTVICWLLALMAANPLVLLPSLWYWIVTVPVLT